MNHNTRHKISGNKMNQRTKIILFGKNESRSKNINLGHIKWIINRNTYYRVKMNHQWVIKVISMNESTNIIYITPAQMNQSEGFILINSIMNQ